MMTSAFPRRGEIYLVKLPGKPSNHKSHPALIVSMDVRNRLANDVIVVPLTTNLKVAPTHVKIPSGEGGLNRASMAKCEQIATLDKILLLRGPFAGTISSEKMKEVEKAIQRAVGVFRGLE